MTRAVIVDDQELVRAGIRRVLLSNPSIEIVGEASDGDEVEGIVHDTQPDVVVMDIRMKRMSGIDATRRLLAHGSGARVLVLTTFDDDDVLSAALRAGASGFVLKDAPGEDIVRAVVEVAAGGAWLDPAVTERVLTTYRAADMPSVAPAGLPEPLTPRELDVLRVLARGATNAEIADQLAVSEVTVKTHISHIFMKLGVRDRAGAIVYAFDHGIVAPRA